MGTQVSNSGLSFIFQKNKKNFLVSLLNIKNFYARKNIISIVRFFRFTAAIAKNMLVKIQQHKKRRTHTDTSSIFMEVNWL
jgi:hypothetical protein